jgi:hypothetical protein
MTEEQRKKLENEAKSWLQIQINEIAIKKGCALKSDQKYLNCFQNFIVFQLFLVEFFGIARTRCAMK